MTRFLKAHRAFHRKQVRAHRGAYTQKVASGPGAGAGGSVSRQGGIGLGEEFTIDDGSSTYY